jgi:hypothetical protein
MATMNRPLLRFWKAMALFIPAWLGAAVIAGIVQAVIPASGRALAGLPNWGGTAFAIWVLMAIGGAIWSVVHVSKRSAEGRKRRKGLAQRAEYEHQMLMRGDVRRGTFGQYPPAET